MIALAQQITKATEKLETHMKANNLPMPSFDVDAPADFPTLPEDVQQSRLEIIHATKELGLLAHGPRESIRWGVWEVSACQHPHPPCMAVPVLTIPQFIDVLALAAVNHYGLGKS
jgi:hypothetical protein